MEIKTGYNEGKTHIALKKRAIELIGARDDVIDIETEFAVRRKRGKYFTFADVSGLKEDGSRIYVEVKSDNTLPQAISQLFILDGNHPHDEFIVICNFDRIDFFRTVWINDMYDFQAFISKVVIFNFNDDYELNYRKAEFKNNGEFWLDGEKMFYSKSHS